MQETQALNLLDIPRSTFKEWSNPAHKKHKLYLLLKQIDVQYAQSCIVQKVPTHIMATLNRNIKQEERFSRHSAPKYIFMKCRIHGILMKSIPFKASKNILTMARCFSVFIFLPNVCVTKNYNLRNS